MSGMRRASRWGTRVLAAWLATSASAAAQGVCVPASVEEELAACPSGAAVAPRRPGSAVVLAHASRGETPAHATAQTPATPGIRATPELLDPHASRRQRDQRLLERQRTILTRLAARTPLDDPQRPEILRRLAETYAELIAGAERRARSFDEPMFQARGRRREGLLRRQQEAEQSEREARAEAVRVLAELVRDHPNAPHADEALYTLAYHLERMGEGQRARQAYQRLIRGYSGSRYVPHAYLAFAEHAFEEGQLDDARQLYRRVLDYPPERNPVYTYARYKLAWVEYNDERYQDALEELVRVIELVRAHPDTADGASLARQARREIVLPYAHVGRPDRALAFFRRVGDDEGDALSMLEHLGELYFDEGHWADAIAVHHRLMAEEPRSSHVCAWQARVLDATISSRPKADQVREARRLLQVRPLAQNDAGAARECEEHAATSLVLLATAWHREAIGTADQPGTRDEATMELASEVYTLLADELPDLDALSLSSIDARDWPSRAQLAFFHGELLFELHHWPACAAAYERALDGTNDPQLAADASYGAVLCYDRHLGTREPPAEDAALAERALTPDEERMARTFRRFACVAPEHEELPIVLYRWARLYYEANQFERAALLFERVATQHPESEVGEYAANLYLDSLNMLLEHRERSACLARIEGALDPLHQRYCRDEGAHPDLCGALAGLRCDIGARRAAELARAGDHREAAERYLALARSRQCEDEDAYLFAAAREYRRVGLIGRTIRVRVALIEAHPESRFAQRAVYLVGADYHALAIYQRAAEWYERYAREQGRARCQPDDIGACPDAAEGLQNAVSFRLGLGQRDEALEDAHRLEALFARREPERTVEVGLAIGALYTQEARWAEVVSHHTRLLRRHRRQARPDQIARAEVAIGRALVATGDRRRAEPHFEAAVEAYQRVAGATRDGRPTLASDAGATRSASTMVESHTGATRDGRPTLGSDAGATRSATVESDAGDAESTTAERDADALARARLADAASEALFELAEAARERFEAIPFPRLRGSANLARVNRWAQGELGPWMEEKRAAFQAAEAAYGRVHPLGVPRWRIASASRIGDMVAGLVEQVRGSPVPAVIERDPELLDAYWEALDGATERYLAVAQQRYAYCLETATATRYFDERSRHCERALNHLDAGRFPVAAELRGSPTYEAREGAEPGTPELDASREG